MKLRNLIIGVGVLGLLGPASLLAADTASDTPAVATATAAAPTKVADATKPKATQCDKVTGSVIRPSKRSDCKSTGALPMRTYTQEDIERTGEISVAQALRKLDPRFQ
jgi:hypothetical protein